MRLALSTIWALKFISRINIDEHTVANKKDRVWGETCEPDSIFTLSQSYFNKPDIKKLNVLKSSLVDASFDSFLIESII